ncbi:MAG: alpha/beta fold hydrolase [Planctomycetota bacterium]
MSAILRRALVFVGTAYLTLLALSYFVFPPFYFKPPRQESSPAALRTVIDTLTASAFLATGEPLEATGRDGTVLGLTVYAGTERGASTVIIVPDRGQSAAGALEQAAMAWLAGCVVFVLDPRGQGRSGDSLNTLGHREADDLLAVVDTIERRRLGESGITAWGIGSGAAVVVQASLRDARITALVLDAPFASLRERLRYDFSFAGLLPGFLVMLPVELALRGSSSFVPGFNPQATDIEHACAQLEIPTLVLPGSDVPRAQIERIVRALPAPIARQISLADRPEPSDPALRRSIKQFLNHRL